jgi:hypothetical protein
MAFSQSFTGKGTISPLPQADKSAQQGLNAMIVAAEELKYKTYKSNRDEFLKNANIDPLFVLSDSARKTQMSMISEFNKKWGKRAQETNYNLSDEDRQNMLTEKNFITATAQDQLATMERFKQHRELVQKNPGKFDPIKFAEAADTYMQTGHYDKTIPDWQPIDFGAYVKQESEKIKGEYNENTIRDQYGQIQQETYNIPAGQEGKFIISQLGKNPQADADFWNKWGSADKEKYFKLADENKDNKFSPEEQQNAIALWATDTFGSQARVRQLSTPKNLPSARKSRASISPVEKVNTGKLITVKRYGTINYPNSYEFDGATIFRNVSTNGAIGVYGDYEEVLASGNVAGRLLLYNPDKDVFVFESVGSSESAETKGQTLIEVPAKNISDADNIKVEGGTIGELRKNKPAKGTTIKKKFNYATGKLEEVTE